MCNFHAVRDKDRKYSASLIMFFLHLEKNPFVKIDVSYVYSQTKILMQG